MHPLGLCHTDCVRCWTILKCELSWSGHALWALTGCIVYVPGNHIHEEQRVCVQVPTVVALDCCSVTLSHQFNSAMQGKNDCYSARQFQCTGLEWVPHRTVLQYVRCPDGVCCVLRCSDQQSETRRKTWLVLPTCLAMCRMSTNFRVHWTWLALEGPTHSIDTHDTIYLFDTL